MDCVRACQCDGVQAVQGAVNSVVSCEQATLQSVPALILRLRIVNGGSAPKLCLCEALASSDALASGLARLRRASVVRDAGMREPLGSTSAILLCPACMFFLSRAGLQAGCRLFCGRQASLPRHNAQTVNLGIIGLL